MNERRIAVEKVKERKGVVASLLVMGTLTVASLGVLGPLAS